MQQKKPKNVRYHINKPGMQELLPLPLKYFLKSEEQESSEMNTKPMFFLCRWFGAESAGVFGLLRILAGVPLFT